MSFSNQHQDRFCPYQGLVPYSEKDAPFFFGREKWCRIITNNLMSSRLTLLYGASGVGKSSVLHAGVAYHLREIARRNLSENGTPEFAVVVFSTWRDDPIAGLVQKVEKDIRKILPEVVPPTHAASLASTLPAWAKLLGNKDHSGKLLIILDQFEEYFLYHPHETGEKSFALQFPAVLNLPNFPVNFLISIREEALAKLDRFKGSIPNLFTNYLRIPHLDEQSAIDAIRQPIRVFNQQQKTAIAIEAEVVKEVLEQVRAVQNTLDETGQGGVELLQKTIPSALDIETPYLQLVMKRLWEEERKVGSDRLRLETLKKLKGAGNIVRQHLDQRMKRLSATEQNMAAKIFPFLVTPGKTKIAYSVAELAESAAVKPRRLAALLEKLARGEQLILRPVSSLPNKPDMGRYEIFHDTLAPAILAWRREYLQEQKTIKGVAIAGLFVILISPIVIYKLWQDSIVKTVIVSGQVQQQTTKQQTTMPISIMREPVTVDDKGNFSLGVLLVEQSQNFVVSGGDQSLPIELRITPNKKNHSIRIEGLANYDLNKPIEIPIDATMNAHLPTPIELKSYHQSSQATLSIPSPKATPSVSPEFQNIGAPDK